MVVDTVAWPRRFDTATISVPWLMRIDAMECIFATNHALKCNVHKQKSTELSVLF